MFKPIPELEFDYYRDNDKTVFEWRLAQAFDINGQELLAGALWSEAVVHPDDTVEWTWTERLSDIAIQVGQIESHTRKSINLIVGTGSESYMPDTLFVGDMIKQGIFDSKRLEKKFQTICGGKWTISWLPKHARSSVLIITITRHKS